MEAITSQLRDMGSDPLDAHSTLTCWTHFSLIGFGDAEVSSAAARFRASSPVPALEAVIDWIVAHPQPEAARATGQASGGVAGAAAHLVFRTHDAHASMRAYPPNFSAAAAVTAAHQGPQEGEYPPGSRIRVTSFGKVYTTHSGLIESLGVRHAAGFTFDFSGAEQDDGDHGVVVSSILRSEVEGGCV